MYPFWNSTRLQTILRSHCFPSSSWYMLWLPPSNSLALSDHLIMPFGTVCVVHLKQHHCMNHQLVGTASSTLFISVDWTKGLRLWYCECEHTHQWSRNWRGIWWGEAHRRWTWVWERFVETVHETFHCYYQLWQGTASGTRNSVWITTSSNELYLILLWFHNYIPIWLVQFLTWLAKISQRTADLFLSFLYFARQCQIPAVHYGCKFSCRKFSKNGWYVSSGLLYL